MNAQKKKRDYCRLRKKLEKTKLELPVLAFQVLHLWAEWFLPRGSPGVVSVRSEA